MKHLKLEVDEAIESGEADEYADCLILLLDAARRQGLTLSGLIVAATTKQTVNEKRLWPRTKVDEPVHHVTEEQKQIDRERWAQRWTEGD